MKSSESIITAGTLSIESRAM